MSAAGLYQFTSQTWLGLLRQYGARYGQAELTKANGRRPEHALGQVAAIERRAPIALKPGPGLLASLETPTRKT